jgi:anti-anti-sigma factor
VEGEHEGASVTYLDLNGRVEATELERDLYVVSAHGPTDERVAGELRDVLIPIAAADGTTVVLDLEDAHGLDGETFRVVAEAAHLIRMRGERLQIVTTSSFTSDLVSDSGLGDVVDVVDSLRTEAGA